MDQLNLIKQMGAFIAAVMGSETEVVIHDTESGQIIWIANGWITDRQVGKTDQTSSIRLLAERARELGGDQLIGYHSKSGGERKLRSSNLFIRDETGELRYTLCINQDVTALLQINDYLQKFTHNLLLEQPTAPQEQLTIEELTLNIILDEIEQAKPFSLDSREGKLTILKKLDEKGIFEVRHAVPKVCQLLEIAQATLYKYLKEIKTDHTMREEQS